MTLHRKRHVYIWVVDVSLTNKKVRDRGGDYKVGTSIADWSLCLLPTDVTGRQRSAMYDGASPCSALYVSRHSFNWTCCETGSSNVRSVKKKPPEQELTCA